MVFKPVNSTSDAKNLFSSKTNISNVLISSSKQGTESRAVPTINEGITLAEPTGLTNQPIPTGTIEKRRSAQEKVTPVIGVRSEQRRKRKRHTCSGVCPPCLWTAVVRDAGSTGAAFRQIMPHGERRCSMLWSAAPMVGGP